MSNPVPQPDCLGFIPAAAWENIRSDSLLKQLAGKQLAGKNLLAEALGRVLEAAEKRGQKGAKLRALAAWLKTMGLPCDARALDGLLPYAVQSKTWLSCQVVRDMGLDPETPGDLRGLLSQQAYAILMNEEAGADTIVKLSNFVHQRTTEGQNDQRLRMQAQEYERRLEAQRMEGAGFFDAVLAEADRLERLREARRASLAANESTAERLKSIAALVWGKQLAGGEG